MIANVVIHIINEQPLMADLFGLPTATDVGLLCTNLRGMDGKRPIFVDHMASTFFFPYRVIRFLELPEGTAPEPDAPPARRERTHVRHGAAATADDGTRTGAAEPGSLLPVAVGADAGGEGIEGDLDIDLEIDEGFLQRIRDI